MSARTSRQDARWMGVFESIVCAFVCNVSSKGQAIALSLTGGLLRQQPTTGTSSAVATAPFLAALGTIKGAAVAELVEPASYLGKLYSTTDRQYRPKV